MADQRTLLADLLSGPSLADERDVLSKLAPQEGQMAAVWDQDPRTWQGRMRAGQMDAAIPAYQALSPDPNSTYGMMLPFARDNATGDLRPALPTFLRDLATGWVDAPLGRAVGEITPLATSALAATGIPSPAPEGTLRSGVAMRAVKASAPDEALSKAVAASKGAARQAWVWKTPEGNFLINSGRKPAIGAKLAGRAVGDEWFGGPGLLAKTGSKEVGAAEAAGKSLPMDEASRMARARNQGWDLGWYHGTDRLDRLVEKGKIDPKRATSGPMPFFSDSPEIASSYAAGKADTSLPADLNIADMFTTSPKNFGYGGRSPVSVERSWYMLSPEQKATILERAKRVGYENIDEGDGKLILHAKGVNATNAGDHFDYVLKTEARGNPLAALRELWHDSGNLIGNESDLAKIYKLAGYPFEISDNLAPWVEAKGVLPAALRIKSPLRTDDTKNLVENVIPALEKAFKGDRSRKKLYGADMWDKNVRFTPKEWIGELKDEINSGSSLHVFTSIPDKITEQLKSLGYDGIIDQGGKLGGDAHRVAIPFYPNQVRSRFAAFDPAKADSADLLAAKTGSKEVGAAEAAGKSLPMDEASRMARAKAMGFDTNKVWYHGTARPGENGITAFDISRANDGLTGRGIYMTDSPQIAGGGPENTIAPQGYATNETFNKLLARENELLSENKTLQTTIEKIQAGKQDGDPSIFMDWLKTNNEELASLAKSDDFAGGQVYPLLSNVKNPADPTKLRITRSSLNKETVHEIGSRLSEIGKNPKGKWPMSYDYLSTVFGNDFANDVVKSLGYDGLKYQGGKMTGVPIKHNVLMAFEPRNIRSRFAAFDPAKADSADLLASKGSPELLASLLANRPAQDQRNQDWLAQGGM